MIEKIISGGQTGGDQGGLRAAKKRGVPTGGHIPYGYRTEDGPNPELGRLYGLIPTRSSNYRERTFLNVKNSDITVYIRRRDSDSLGFWKTNEFACKLHKPFWDISDFRFNYDVLNVCRFFRLFDYKIVNIAGNRESKDHGIGEWAEDFVSTFIEVVNKL